MNILDRIHKCAFYHLDSIPYFNHIYCLGSFLFPSEVQPKEHVPFENHRHYHRSRTFIFSRCSWAARLVTDQTTFLRLTQLLCPYQRSTLAFSFSMFYFIQSPMGDIADIKGVSTANGRISAILVMIGLKSYYHVFRSPSFLNRTYDLL